VKVSLGTDNVPVSLFVPIWQSVARISRYSGERIVSGQCLSREQAIRAATINGAYLTFEEARKGSLEVGKLADLVVLDADPLSVPERKIRDIRSVMTMVGGRVVFAGEDWGG
jgi:predicted amidohydrolase YtcJ